MAKRTIGDITLKIIKFIDTERTQLIPLHIYIRKFKNISTEGDVKEFIARYYIFKPLIDIFFNKEVIDNNPIVKETERFMPVFHLEQALDDDDIKIVDSYYGKIKTSYLTSEKKQDILLQTIEQYLQGVNKAKSEKNGEVFTPTEIIDFLINSTEYILKRDFGKTLNDINLIDPFTGIAPFVVKLIDHMEEEAFLSNVYANELNLFSFFIAKLNIENIFYNKYGYYREFKNLILSDTFKDLKNDEEREKKRLEIAITFAKRKSEKKRGEGIISFITNGSFLEADSLDGFRKTLETEFDEIYLINLRGNSRTRGDLNKREGENIFKNGCRTTVCLVILVKK